MVSLSDVVVSRVTVLRSQLWRLSLIVVTSSFHSVTPRLVQEVKAAGTLFKSLEREVVFSTTTNTNTNLTELTCKDDILQNFSRINNMHSISFTKKVDKNSI